VELAPPHRPAPQLGRDIDRALVAHLGNQPEAPLADPERVRGPGLEFEGRIEGDDLPATVEVAVAAASELDLARERDEPSRCSAIRLETAAETRAKLEALSCRLRLAFLEGAEEQSRGGTGRSLTVEELNRLVGRYPGDWLDGQVRRSGSQ